MQDPSSQSHGQQWRNLNLSWLWWSVFVLYVQKCNQYSDAVFRAWLNVFLWPLFLYLRHGNGDGTVHIFCPHIWYNTDVVHKAERITGEERREEILKVFRFMSQSSEFHDRTSESGSDFYVFCIALHESKTHNRCTPRTLTNAGTTYLTPCTNDRILTGASSCGQPRVSQCES